VPCVDWIVYPASDPLYLYPLPTLRYYHDEINLFAKYFEANLTTPVSNTIIGVIAPTISNFKAFTENTTQVRGI
jgi:hypothetical protein